MFDWERETLGTLRRQPGLLACGAVAAVALLAVHLVVVVPVTLLVLPKRTQPAFVVPLTSALSVLVLPAALAGLYAAVHEGRAREEDPGLVETLRLYGGGVLEHAAGLTAATVGFRVVALVPALATFVVLLAGDTALNYWQYATPGNPPVRTLRGSAELIVVLLYAMAAGAVDRLVFAFYDLPVLFGGVPARRGWRAALRFARRQPRALARYGAGRLLLWSPMVVVLVLELGLATGQGSPGGDLGAFVLFAGAALLVGTAVATTIAVYHVVVYERSVEPVLTEPTPTDESPTASGESPVAPAPGVGQGGGGSRVRPLFALALVALVVTGLAAGTATVRLADSRPMPPVERPVSASMDGADVVGNSEAVLANASLRTRTRTYRVNDSTGERTLYLVTNVSVDRVDRRAWMSGGVRSDGEWQRQAYFGSETTLAFDFPGEEDDDRRVGLLGVFAGRTSGEWAIMYYPGYSFVQQFGNGLPIGDDEDDPVAVLARTDERVVVGYDRRPERDSVRREHVRLVVDRDTGRPVRLVENVTYVERENGTVVERYRTVTVQTFEYGQPAVERPEPAGSPGPLELLWDLVYY